MSFELIGTWFVLIVTALLSGMFTGWMVYVAGRVSVWAEIVVNVVCMLVLTLVVKGLLLLPFINADNIDVYFVLAAWFGASFALKVREWDEKE